MITEEKYLAEKQYFEELQMESDNFIKDHFVPLFQSFNPDMTSPFNIKEIKPHKKSGYIVFSYPMKRYNEDSLFVNFEVNDNGSVSLTYTEDSKEKAYSEMVKKAKLYTEALDMFHNFNVKQFNELIEQYLALNEKLSDIKRKFLALEKEYFQNLSKKYQNVLLSVINTYIDKDKANSILDSLIERELEEQEKKKDNKHYYYRPEKLEVYSFSFDLESVRFKEVAISISFDSKNNKPVCMIDGRKTSRKKCIEAIQNQFLYNDEKITSFRQFETIPEFKEELFERFSSWECYAKLSTLVKPFMVNVLAQNF